MINERTLKMCANLQPSCVLVVLSVEGDPSLIQTLRQTGIQSQTKLVVACRPLSRCLLASSLSLIPSLTLILMKPFETLEAGDPKVL